MGYLNNQVVTVDAILTKKGRELMARGDGSFDITQFALSDDEVDYKLVTLARGTALMPTLQLSAQSLDISNNGEITLKANTINYLDGQTTEQSGYQFTISDVRLTSTFIGNGLGPDADAENQSNSQTVITNGTATSKTVIGLSCSGTATGVPTLFTNTSTLYGTITVVGLDSGARAQGPITISNRSIVTKSAGVGLS